MNYIVYLQRTLAPKKADSLKTLPPECSQIKIGLSAHWVGGSESLEGTWPKDHSAKEGGERVYFENLATCL